MLRNKETRQCCVLEIEGDLYIYLWSSRVSCSSNVEQYVIHPDPAALHGTIRTAQLHTPSVFHSPHLCIKVVRIRREKTQWQFFPHWREKQLEEMTGGWQSDQVPLYFFVCSPCRLVSCWIKKKPSVAASSRAHWCELNGIIVYDKTWTITELMASQPPV